MQKMHTKQSGFTLVEMAIVLVIIGIILAGVMKGRDIIHSGLETQAEQSYFQKWRGITDDFHKATGMPLTDGERNGGTVATTPDGYMDAITDPDNWAAPGNLTNIYSILTKVGIDPCMLIKTTISAAANSPCTENKNPYRYMVDSEYSGKIGVKVGWSHAVVTLSDGFARHKNILTFFNVPLSQCQRIDRIVDGIPNGNEGRVFNFSLADAGGGNTGYACLQTTAALSGAAFGAEAPAAGAGFVSGTWPIASDTTAADAPNLCYTLGMILDY